MADLAVGLVKDIVKTSVAIKNVVDTFHRNEEEFQDLKVLVATIMAILSRLQEIGLMNHPAMCATALVGLHQSLDGALKLVTKWQKRKGIHRLLMARDMAKQLHRVHDNIQRKMQLGNLAITASMMEVTIEWTRTTTVRYEGSHPLLTQPQDAAEMEIYSSHSIAGDAGKGRSYEDEIITMVATTGTQAPSALASSVTEFSLSETMATHHVTDESTNGERSYTRVTKKKIVFKVCMSSVKSRVRAMALVAKAAGVWSMGVTGDGNDRIEVIGDSVDPISLVSCLRKKIGHSEIVLVEELNDKKPDGRKPEEPKVLYQLPYFHHLLPGESSSSMTFSAATPQDCDNQYHEHDDTSVRRAKLSGDHIEKPDLLLPEHQPETSPLATAPVRRTFNMSRVHRSVRIPAARNSRWMQPTKPVSSSERWGARVLRRLLVPCALCALLLLASVWALC